MRCFSVGKCAGTAETSGGARARNVAFTDPENDVFQEPSLWGGKTVQSVASQRTFRRKI
jgi:hypothetical protein